MIDAAFQYDCNQKKWVQSDYARHSNHLIFRSAAEKDDTERLWASMEVRGLPKEGPPGKAK